MMMSEQDRDGGFALVTVLWAAMALALVTAGILSMARGETMVTRGSEQRAKEAALADAAINLVLLRLVGPRAGPYTPLDGTAFVVNFEGHRIQMRVQDESGRIDLNVASPELLRQLLMV